MPDKGKGNTPGDPFDPLRPDLAGFPPLRASGDPRMDEELLRLFPDGGELPP